MAILAIGLAALLLALLVYAFWIEPAMRLRVVRHQVRHPGWGDRAPLRIVIISDLHAGAPHIPLRRVSRIVRRANALNPDVAVLLGDYSAAHRFTTGGTDKFQIIERLKAFTAPLGCYAVLGNHDWWQDEKSLKNKTLPEAAKALDQHGIPLLENANVRLRDGADAFVLAGLADQRPQSLDPEVPGFDDLDAALNGVASDTPVVLLAHEPDIFPKVPDNVLVTLSGHTHGGQIRTFGFHPVIMVAETETYSWGRYDRDAGQVLIVSGGIGCSDYPVRFGMVPEITVVELS
ncbi:metallophosphoesterase [Pseudoprimorskyibacter insulae]|uniref:metallophosphoesterase n=1 Tax=Pseudoprimorskyibacter insulae TaxID=1695997 RepID=UPI001C62EA5A|nr:metallophosphoesterase [Pseudoprimorskyibacter insulae]